jgi:Bacterial SH3 domain
LLGSLRSQAARAATALGLGVALAGCGLFGGSGGHASRQTQPTVKSTVGTTTTTVPGVQTSGPRTVLSPIGLHVRAAPSLSARVLGTAGRGTALEVLGHTGQGGGWYRVKGATVTGWISANPSLSAAGTFRDYASGLHQFRALFPLTWTVVESHASAIFRSRAGTEYIVVNTAPTVARLGPAVAGYHQTRTETMVACGVTGDLVTYTKAGTSGTAPSPSYYAQIHLALDRTHALGIEAKFPALSDLQALRDFTNSITFPFPECEG